MRRWRDVSLEYMIIIPRDFFGQTEFLNKNFEISSGVSGGPTWLEGTTQVLMFIQSLTED